MTRGTSRTNAAISPKTIIERTYHAPVEDLWDLWTTKEGFESWWGPDSFRVDVHVIEARVGGALHYSMIADSPSAIAAMQQMGRPLSHEAHARFTEFRPHASLAITHVVDFVPGVKPYESTMRAEFFSVGETTRMVIMLDPMHDEEFTRMSTMGFHSQLGKLEPALKSRRATKRR
jgi:uncharacterized protein YndB with AHSA1/START domain